VNILGFIIGFSSGAAGNSHETTMAVLHKYQPVLVIISLIVSVFGALKGFLPGTKNRKS
jgi:hypothetical protein